MRKKTQIIKKIQIIHPRFNHPNINNIKNEIGALSKEHGDLLKKFNERYDVIFVNQQTEQTYITRTELFNTIQDFHNRVKAYHDKYQFDDFFLNEFVLLQLKADVLVTRAMELFPSKFNDGTILQSYLIIMSHLRKYLDLLEYREDQIFQEEIYFSSMQLLEVAQSTGEGFKNHAGQGQVFYLFSLKCSDNFIKLNLQFYFVKSRLLNKSVPQLEKTKLSKEFVGLYESIEPRFNKVNKTEVSFESRLQYINSIFVIFKFLEETHPTLISYNHDRDFNITNKEYLKKIFKVHDNLKHTYIGQIVKLVSEIDLGPLNKHMTEISEVRSVIKTTFVLLRDDVAVRFEWIKMLNCVDDKADLDDCRKTIIEHYKYVEKLYGFGSRFLKKYQQINGLFSSKDNFEGLMQNLDEINKVITDFRKEEIIRDAACEAEKKEKLDIADECAKFLVAYENRQKAFAQEKSKKRLAKEEPTVNKEIAENKTQKQNNKQRKTNQVQPVTEKTSLYLDYAYQKVLRSKYDEAATSYDQAQAHGVSILDMDIQLMALDGLSISYANLLLQDLNKLSSIFKSRTKDAPPLTRDKRISLEVSIKNIVDKLDYVANLSWTLIALSQTSKNIDGDYIKFIQHQLDDLLLYVEFQIKTIQQKYSDVVKSSEAGRKAFLQELGRAEAAKLHIHAEYSQLMDLGYNKFISIGTNKMEKGQRYSDHTNERILLDELDPLFKYLSSKKLSLLPTEFLKTGSAGFYKPVCSAKNQMVMGTVNLVLPKVIQDMFNHLDTVSKAHYLHGSTVINLLLNKYNLQSVEQENIDFLTTCHDKQILFSAGFIPCVHRDNLYFYSTTGGQVDLLSIQDDPLQFMLKRIFTISTLYCIWQGEDKASCYDLTGRGLRDLEQMRLVMVEDPTIVFARDPTNILFVQKYCLKGFHPELNIMNALRNLKPPENFDREHFNALVSKKLASLEYQGRKQYVQWFIQYGLLNKLFNIKECRLSQAITTLGLQLGVSDVSTATNQNGFYAEKGRDDKNLQTGLIHHNGLSCK